jgi:hypothetical protein
MHRLDRAFVNETMKLYELRSESNDFCFILLAHDARGDADGMAVEVEPSL